MPHFSSFQRLLAPIGLAATVGLSAISLPAIANPGDVNSTNNGQVVTGGTYYNTPGDKTTFTNTAGTGLYITTGTTVTAREVGNAANPTGSLTGNGGWVNFYAPHQVVRIDGKIDANAIMNNGVYTGNGGKVTVEAAYVYQSGQIYANGHHGGTVSFNVGSMTMSPTAAIYAQGQHGGSGGIVTIGNGHTHGVIDIQPGAIVDVSGKIIGNYDTSIIKIEGGLINMEGILIANGVNANRPSGNGSDGGMIMLTAHGNTTALNDGLLSNASFMSGLKTGLEARDTSLRVNNYDGWIRIGSLGVIQTNGGNGAAGFNDDGGNGGDGGYISLTAKCGIENNGTIQNNGGLGGNAPTTFGTLSYVSTGHHHGHIEEDAVGKDGGNGGDGGNIDFQYGTHFVNNGSIQSIGGNGGHGGNAIAFNPLAKASWAYGADGGNGSDGGNIDFTGGHAPVNNGEINQHGGVGGMAGFGFSQTPGNSFNGDNGTHGDRGIYDYTHVRLCTDGCGSAPGGNPIAPVPVDPGTPTPVTTASNPLNPNFNGLFQNYRPIFNLPTNNPTPPLMFALSHSRMFLAKTYSSVTQEILTLALTEYTRLRTNGTSVNEATAETRKLLQNAGVDKDVAQSLLTRIHDGRLHAGDVVVQLLTDIADGSKTSMLLSQP